MRGVFSRVQLWLALCLVACLAACGGGGGSEPAAGGNPVPGAGNGGVSAAAPTITTPPVAASVRAGQTASFSVVADGTQPLSYQWLRDGVPVAGATAASYTLQAGAADSGARFSVRVSNAAGSATSSAVPLAVPAKVAGILLDGDAATQVTTDTVRITGALLLESAGDLPVVRWRTTGAAEASGTASLTALGFAIDVPVAIGDTVIEVLAQDGQDQPIPSTRRITRNAGQVFAGTLELTRNVVFVNEAATTLARIALDKDTVVSGSVKLVQTAADGSETDVATLVDDGNLNNGDEVQADGVYSASFQINAAAEGKRSYRVKATLATGGVARSVATGVQVTARLPDALLNETLALQSAATGRLKTAAGAGIGALKAAVATEVQTLKASPLVAQAAPNEAGTAVSVFYKSGIGGVVGDPDPALKGGAVATQAARGPALSPAWLQQTARSVQGAGAGPALAAYAAYCDEQAAQPQARALAAGGQTALAVGTTDAVGSNRVYALAANYAEWGENDDVPKMAAQLQLSKCLDVTYKKVTTKGGGSVEDFKNLGSYGMVLISSHGDTHFTYLGFRQFGDLFLGWSPASAQVVLYSNMRVTTANKSLYEEDLKAGRLVIWGDVYGVMPSFIRKYAGKMPASLVYMSICRGAYNSTMADAFIGNGAKAYLGYSDYVAVSFTVNTATTLFTEFLKTDKTLGDAHAAVSPKVESDSDPAEFRLLGATAVKAPLQGLSDGSFESGALGAWKPTGDGRVLTQLGQSVPQDGKYLAVISTGLGFTTSAGSLEQTLCLGSQTTLSYRWNFFSEEFLEYVGSSYQDAFTVTLTDADNPANTVTVQRDTVDSLASGVAKVSNVFDRGDVYATGWRTRSFTIPPALQGKRVVLRFSVTDVGDSAYDSVVLLDAVALQ